MNRATSFAATLAFVLALAFGGAPSSQAGDTRQGLASTEGQLVSDSGRYLPRPDEMRSGFID